MGDTQVGYVELWRPQRRLRGDASDSYIGGLPATFSGQLTHGPCTSCGKALRLVVQVYAPADTERNLLVFGCNNSACYGPGRASGTWIAYRSQTDTLQLPSSTPLVDATRLPALLAAPSTDDDWGAAGAWGSDAAVESAVAAIEQLSVEAAAAQAVAEEASRAAHEQAAAEQGQDVEGTGEPCFPRFTMLTCPEPYPDAASDEEGDDDNDDGEVGDMGDGRGSGGVVTAVGTIFEDAQLAHARRLYEQYEQEQAVGGEEDERSDEEEYDEGVGEDGEGNDNRQEPHPKDERRAAKLKAVKPGPDLRAGSERRRQGGSRAGGGGGGGEKYEALPPRYRYALHFQRRISGLPSQVVRYDWGGYPLWPCPPPSVPRGPRGGGGGGLAVPPCPHCRAHRRFELQLMPGLLFGLKPEEYTGVAEEDVGGAGAPPQFTLSGGMDWLSILVYTCEASCGGSCIRQEWCHVVPPDMD